MDDLPNLQELKTEESIFDNHQKNALETIRELSGQLWTDHAPHDPGITTSLRRGGTSCRCCRPRG